MTHAMGPRAGLDEGTTSGSIRVSGSWTVRCVSPAPVASEDGGPGRANRKKASAFHERPSCKHKGKNAAQRARRGERRS